MGSFCAHYGKLDFAQIHVYTNLILIFTIMQDQREAASEVLTNTTEIESIYSTLGEVNVSKLQSPFLSPKLIM